MNIYELAKIEEFENLDFWQLKKIEELTEKYDKNKLFDLQEENEELQEENEELQDENENWETRFLFFDSKIEEIQEEIERCIEMKEYKEIKEKLGDIWKKLQKIR